MLLSARILNNVANVNVFTYDDTARFTEGDAPSIYFQLLDLGQDRPEHGFAPPGRRYVPAVGATVEVTLASIDSAKTIVRVATQPFVQDPSIWVLTLFPTDQLRGTMDLRIKVTEGIRVTRGVLRHAVTVEPQNASF